MNPDPQSGASDLAVPANAVHSIAVEVIKPETFKPFGLVIGRDMAGSRLPRNTYRSNRVFRSRGMECDEECELLVLDGRLRPLEVKLVERHLKIAQMFIPLGGAPFVCAVARPEAELDRGVPTLDEIRAFYVPGNMVVQLHRGTWHEPPFPLGMDTLMLITSHPELTRGLAAERNVGGELHVGDVDKRSVAVRTGSVIRLVFESSSGS